ncbi:hypothetical protein MOQ72_43285 [Saccharopolyspora sp. K220]|uniref:AfsR/SARP family transcriptional regulator n=1 Tax=Saccharopolyspora soli TaxID=2926618 RepID=UPI001F594AB8|nr:BTAD domain-containing putative transcriptional regulator [Saccharopolyspora soli]MCI2424238.1 hypothetical protein [Saccharopolyspora soli]
MGVSWNGVRIVLLGGFEFTYLGTGISLPAGAQRLLAFLALHTDGAHRVAAAEHLWPDCGSSRASANLRSALWKVRQVGPVTVIDSVGSRLRLSPAAHVDLHQVWYQAQQIFDVGRSSQECCDELINDLTQELLPGWSEDWLVLERDRWDQMRLHALENLAQQLRTAERYLPALNTALAALAIEPLRDTAHRIVIDVHIAEGNLACALKHYRRYRAILHQELGVAPSAQMTQLVRDLMTM